MNLPNASSHLLSNPSIVLRNGAIHVAYFEAEAPCGMPECGQVIYRRQAAGATTFTDATSPVPAGTDVTLARPFSLAVDSAGNAGLTYFAGPLAAGAGPVSLLFWRPSGTTTTQVADSGPGLIPRTSSVSLTFSDANPRVAYHLPLSTSVTGQLWYGAATDAMGSTFTRVEIPRNSAGSTFEGTSSFQAIALDPTGKLAIAASHVGPSVDQGCKGGPKVARSSDGTTFVTCRPDTGSNGVFGFAGLWMNAAFHKADKLTLAFTYETNANPLVTGGVIVFRQP